VWGTLAGEEFRDYLDKWDATCLQEKRDNQIRLLVDGQDFVLFFEFEDDIYATHEPHRVTFARMKSEDDEDDLDITKAKFTAFNLSKAVSGKTAQDLFYMEDIPNIDVISKEEAMEKLSKQSKSVEPERIATGAKAIIKALHRAKVADKPSGDPKDKGLPLNQIKK